MFKQVACVVLVCDECSEPYQGYEDVTVHFDDTEKGRADALSDATDDPDSGWEVGEKHTCHGCIERRPHPFDRYSPVVEWCRVCSTREEEPRHSRVVDA